MDILKCKKKLISELKQVVKRIRRNVTMEGCLVPTKRLYRIGNNNGNYIY